MIKKEIERIIKNNLLNPGIKHEIVCRLNSNINVPFINEKTEQKILDALITQVFEVIEEKITE
jgi:hypothetical protein